MQIYLHYVSFINSIQPTLSFWPCFTYWIFYTILVNVDCFLLVAATAPPASGEPMKPKDPRDLEDLLDFIEGNPSLKCKDEKKAAKKARQKQKKVRFI